MRRTTLGIRMRGCEQANLDSPGFTPPNDGVKPPLHALVARTGTPARPFPVSLVHLKLEVTICDLKWPRSLRSLFRLKLSIDDAGECGRPEEGGSRRLILLSETGDRRYGAVCAGVL